MKKIISSILLCSMLLTTATLAANTSITMATNGAKVVTVSLDSIEQIMTDFSPTMKKIKNDRDTASSSYQKIQDKMDDLKDIISAAPDTSAGWALASQTSKQVESLEDTRDQAKLNKDIAAEQYMQKVQQQVVTTKQQYLSCALGGANLENAQQQVKAQKQKLANAKQQVDKSYLSTKAYEAMAQSTDDMVLALRAQQTNLDADKRNLRLSLGIPDDVEMVLTKPDLSKFDFGQIVRLDLNADTKIMLECSVSIKNAKLTYESYRDNDYAVDAQTQSAKIGWEQSQKNATESMKALYEKLQDGYQALVTARMKLATQKTTLANVQAKYEYGYSSAKVLTDIRNQTDSMATSVSSQEMSLYISYLNYQQMKSV